MRAVCWPEAGNVVSRSSEQWIRWRSCPMSPSRCFMKVGLRPTAPTIMDAPRSSERRVPLDGTGARWISQLPARGARGRGRQEGSHRWSISSLRTSNAHQSPSRPKPWASPATLKRGRLKRPICEAVHTGSSTVNCPGCSSTAAFSKKRRTGAIRSWSSCAFSRSRRTTWMSSSWCA